LGRVNLKDELEETRNRGQLCQKQRFRPGLGSILVRGLGKKEAGTAGD